MCVCKTARRRRAQAAGNYRHLSPQTRPHYIRRSADVLTRRLAVKIARQKEMAARSKKKAG